MPKNPLGRFGKDKSGEEPRELSDEMRRSLYSRSHQAEMDRLLRGQGVPERLPSYQDQGRQETQNPEDMPVAPAYGSPEISSQSLTKRQRAEMILGRMRELARNMDYYIDRALTPHVILMAREEKSYQQKMEENVASIRKAQDASLLLSQQVDNAAQNHSDREIREACQRLVKDHQEELTQIDERIVAFSDNPVKYSGLQEQLKESIKKITKKNKDEGIKLEVEYRVKQQKHSDDFVEWLRKYYKSYYQERQEEGDYVLRFGEHVNKSNELLDLQQKHLDDLGTFLASIDPSKPYRDVMDQQSETSRSSSDTIRPTDPQYRVDPIEGLYDN